MLIFPKHLFQFEGPIQDIIIKAEKKVSKAALTEYKFVNEYQEAMLQYLKLVFEKIGEGFAIALGVDPTKIKKSIRLPINSLIKIKDGDEELAIFYKGFFDNLKKKLVAYRDFFKKFGFNRGKPLEPIKFKNKIKYNPETGKALTFKEWDSAVDDLVDFLGDKIGSVEEEMLVRNVLMGKLIQKMESEGMKKKEIKDMTYDKVEKKYGPIPRSIEKAKGAYLMTDQEAYALDYARTRAAKYLSIKDGTLKPKIVGMMRNIITNGIKEKKSAQELVTDLYWGDYSEQLGEKYKENSIEAINRDYARIAVTEMKMAMQNGYMMANVASEPEGNKVYFVFDGSYNPEEKANDACNKYLGKIFLWSKRPRVNDKVSSKDDSYADYYIWYDKSNAGRTRKGWWGCIPLHPWCRHFWSRVNPAIEEWDDELQTIMLKENE